MSTFDCFLGVLDRRVIHKCCPILGEGLHKMNKNRIQKDFRLAITNLQQLQETTHAKSYKVAPKECPPPHRIKIKVSFLFLPHIMGKYFLNQTIFSKERDYQKLIWVGSILKKRGKKKLLF